MKKIASILDYSFPGLDPAVWDKELKLYSYQKDFILRLLDKMYANYKLIEFGQWVQDVTIIGSLTTSKWIRESDLDVHVMVNIPMFKAANMPEASDEEALAHLDAVRKQFDEAKILLPTTLHPCEFYFENGELNPSNDKLVGRYSLYQDKWLREPIIFPADLDYEESKKQVVQQAEDLAEELDASFGKIRRDIKRIDELYTVISAWDKEKQQLFYDKIEKKLAAIEEEIKADLAIKQALVDERHKKQDALSENEIQFKYLARFGFFAILSDLKAILEASGGELRKEDLPLIEKIVTEASSKNKTLLIDFDGTIAKDNPDHSIGEPLEGVKEAMQKLKDMGYSLEIYSCRANDEKGAEKILDWLDKYEIPYDTLFEGEKPFAKHLIDNSAIHFDTWDSVLKQVEKPTKDASLQIQATSKYWLGPNGEEYELNGPVSGHYGWIKDNVWKDPEADLTQEPYATEAHDEANDMLQSGWTRITNETDLDFDAEVADLNSIPGYLDNFIAKHFTGKGIGIDDLSGNYVVIKDPFPSIQKHVTRALQQQTTASKALSKKEIVAQTTKVKQADFGCVMAQVPHDMAQEVVEWGVRNIPDDVIYVDEEGNLGRELDTHITIKYGLETDNAKEVRRLFNDQTTYKAKLGEVKHFEPEDRPFDVVTIEIISEDLNKANAKVTEALECAKGLPSDEYHPHITVAYVKRGTGKDYIGSAEFRGKEIVLDTLVFSPAKGNRTYFHIDKEGQTTLIWHLNKVASHDVGYWVDPSGDVYDCHAEGLVHNEWILANLALLKKQYGLSIPNYLIREAKDYFEAMQTGEEDNFDPPSSDLVWDQMLKSGWARVGDADDGIGLEVFDIRKIPSFIDSLVSGDLHDGDWLRVDDIAHNAVAIQYPFKNVQQAVNKALSSPTKTASGNNFFPSLVQAPNNDWQLASGGSDQEIPVDPDAVSDEETFIDPCNTGKPRKHMWDQVVPVMIKQREVEKESTADPKQEKIEQEELGENETLLEYSKNFKDLNRMNTNKPKTTWDYPALKDQQEPYSPLRPNYTHETNPENVNQNGKDGFPWRFYNMPRGEWHSNDGDITKFLTSKSILSKKELGLYKFAVEQQDVVDFYLLSLLPDSYLDGTEVGPDHINGRALFNSIIATLAKEYYTRGMEELKDEALTTRWEANITDDEMPEELKPYYTFHEQGYPGASSGGESDYSCDGCGAGLSEDEMYNYNDGTYCDGCYDDYIQNDKKRYLKLCTKDNVWFAPSWFKNELGDVSIKDEKEHEGHPFLGYKEGKEYIREVEENNKKQIELPLGAALKSYLKKLAWGGPYWEAPHNFDNFSAKDFYTVFQFAPWEDQYGGPAWAEIAKTVDQMGKVQDFKQLGLLIDHFHDLGHNTGKLLDKFPEWSRWFKNLLDLKASRDAVRQLFPRASKEVQQLVNTYYKTERKEDWRTPSYPTIDFSNSDLNAISKDKNVPPQILYNATKASVERGGQYFTELIHNENFSIGMMDQLLGEMRKSENDNDAFFPPWLLKELERERDRARTEEPTHASRKEYIKKIAAGEVRNVMVVCSGNTCRSPMAENMLKQMRPDLNVISRGLYVASPEKMSPDAIEALREKGIPVAPHQAKQVVKNDVLTSDMILVMSDWQKADLIKLFPEAKGKTYRMGEVDIMDPMGGKPEEYKKVRDEIYKSLSPFHKKTSSLIKKATIEEVDGVKVFVNPNQEELSRIGKNFRKEFMHLPTIRALLDQKTGDIYAWDGWYQEHTAMSKGLGLEVEGPNAPEHWSGTYEDLPHLYALQEDIRRSQSHTATLKLKAGNQSASVPDYLCDEWKTEQIMNDTDEEPYVNHDQRDYPYGMHDSPENTDSGIGWAKDNQPYVVRLDQLQKPFNRTYAPGIGQCDVTWYLSMPMSDGDEV